MKQSITDLMQASGVGFGTSGARGLVTDMTDALCYAYTTGFVSFIHEASEKRGVAMSRQIAVGGDLRPSTERIMRAVMQAVLDAGYQPINCSTLPTPALSLYGFSRAIASIMITGSHIPADRNGLKFNAPWGELLKSDEATMRAQQVQLPLCVNTDAQRLAQDWTATNEYKNRYIKGFGTGFLDGMRIGVYAHSSVSRDLMQQIYQQLGAQVLVLGQSDTFVPVDTEAIREQDIELARDWARLYELDAIVSTDGDGDRPLVADETGQWFRGDILGVIVAKRLGANVVVVPVSCNTAVELCGAFDTVIRTKIGSPYVVEAMLKHSDKKIVGYEANGGFLTGCDFDGPSGKIAALATRDALIVQLAVLWQARELNCKLSDLYCQLPARVTRSGRIKDLGTEQSYHRLEQLKQQGKTAMYQQFGAPCGLTKLTQVDWTDGLRMVFEQGDIVHVRPSGNAPELRCYTEAATAQQAEYLLKCALGVVDKWK